MTSQLGLFSDARAPTLYIADPDVREHHGTRVLRVGLDQDAGCVWSIPEGADLRPRWLRAVIGGPRGGELVVDAGDTLLSRDPTTRRQWAARLRAAGWRVVLDGAVQA